MLKQKTLYTVLALACLFALLTPLVRVETANSARVTNWSLYQAALRVQHQTCSGISLTRYASRCNQIEAKMARLARAADVSPSESPSWLRLWDARSIDRKICGVYAGATPACKWLEAQL